MESGSSNEASRCVERGAARESTFVDNPFLVRLTWVRLFLGIPRETRFAGMEASDWESFR